MARRLLNLLTAVSLLLCVPLDLRGAGFVIYIFLKWYTFCRMIALK